MIRFRLLYLEYISKLILNSPWISLYIQIMKLGLGWSCSGTDWTRCSWIQIQLTNPRSWHRDNWHTGMQNSLLIESTSQQEDTGIQGDTGGYKDTGGTGGYRDTGIQGDTGLQGDTGIQRDTGIQGYRGYWGI